MNKQVYQEIFNYEAIHWWYRGRRRLLVNLLRAISNPVKGKLLDYGCGTGYNLSILNQFGNAYGVDIAPEAIHFCRQRGFKNTKITNGRTIPFSNNYLNLITCLDVLEHIKHVDDMLKEFYRVLKNNSYLIMFIPALPILWSTLDERAHHIRRYTKVEIKQKLENAGFEILQLDYFNYFFFLPILTIRILQKTFLASRNQWGTHAQIKSQLFNKLFTWIFLLDILSLKWISPPIGVSLMILAQKRKN